MVKTRAKPTIRATGRSVAYIQTVSKGGKLGKASPVVITTVRVGATTGAKKPRRRRVTRR
jgi:hypothetical protein